MITKNNKKINHISKKIKRKNNRKLNCVLILKYLYSSSIGGEENENCKIHYIMHNWMS